LHSRNEKGNNLDLSDFVKYTKILVPLLYIQAKKIRSISSKSIDILDSHKIELHSVRRPEFYLINIFITCENILG